MKILEIVFSAPPANLYPNAPNTQRGSGYDMITFEIAKRLSMVDGNSVDVLTMVQFHDFKKIDGVDFLPVSLRCIASHFDVFLFFKSLISLLPFFELKKTVIRDIVYMSLLSGYINYLLKTKNYERVHVHGCSYILETVHYLADKYKKNLIVTLHGLNSFGNDSPQGAESARKYERYFLRMAFENKLRVTFVSTGCLRAVQKFLGTLETPTFGVTLNGCDISDRIEKEIDIRKRFNLPVDSKIIVYVGNICWRKNQVMAIDAFGYLPIELQQNTYILFLGNVQNGYKEIWRDIINASSFKEHFIECGFISQKEIGNFYNQANCTMLISISEGFGLSIIEGMAYGIPSIIDSKMDIVEDVDDENCIIKVDNKDTKSIADGMALALSQDWNAFYIKNYAKRFSMEKMAEKYNSYLNL